MNSLSSCLHLLLLGAKCPAVSFIVYISAVLGTKASGTEVILDPKGEGCAAKRSCPDLPAPPTYPHNYAPFHLYSSKAGLVPVISQLSGWVATESRPHPVPPSRCSRLALGPLWLLLARKVREECGAGTRGSLGTGTVPVTFEHLTKTLVMTGASILLGTLVTSLGYLCCF